MAPSDNEDLAAPLLSPFTWPDPIPSSAPLHEANCSPILQHAMVHMFALRILFYEVIKFMEFKISQSKEIGILSQINEKNKKHCHYSSQILSNIKCKILEFETRGT